VSRFLVAMTLVLLLIAIPSAMAQEWVPAGQTAVAPAAPLPVESWPVPTTTYYAPTTAYYTPAPVMVPAPTVTYYAPAPVYYYPRPAVVAAPLAWPAPVVPGGYTVRTRYFPYSVRTVVRAW
jgi:hypothetical protein